MPGWRMPQGHPWRFDDPWAGVMLAAQAVWHGCGISLARGALRLQPTWPGTWRWWALMGLPLGSGTLSLLWDGEILHSTRPLRAPSPVQVHETIRALKAGEDDFDLEFDFGAGHRRFRPTFARS